MTSKKKQDRRVKIIVPKKRVGELKNYVTAVAAAEALRLRHNVFKRLLASGRIRCVRGVGGTDKRQRYWIASSELERAMREKPWARKHTGRQASRYKHP